MEGIERPLDFLNVLKGKDVIILGRFKDNKEIEKIKGTLLAFDIHINIVVEVDEKTYFFRGNEIISISEDK